MEEYRTYVTFKRRYKLVVKLSNLEGFVLKCLNFDNFSTEFGPQNVTEF